ncbi:type II secretion system protein N [Tepidimonas charontis]|uniref:Type II secretion system protein N n=1 Tax=Tepidimonas charontis TaxID=2267262 RepID=A0A554X6N3_9BURK|nr:type II secretion system protein N [Tepidimonas charontis]TSE31492.1 Type II secretion system (T2SS), protein N [Tepidimonas charontis]
MSARWRAAAAAFVLGLVVGSIVWAPARWWALAVDGMTHGRVRLVHPQGSLWQGEAGLVVRGDGGTLVLPGGIAWRLGAVGAPHPGVTLDLTLRCCAAQAWRWHIGRADGAWLITSQPHRSTWDLAWLGSLGSPWNTLGLQGRLTLEVGALRWPVGTAATGAAAQPTGAWTAEVLDLSAAVSTVRPLGSYRLGGELDDAGPTLRLSTLSGDLHLEGAGGWQRGRFYFEGLAQATPQRLDALSNLLNLLGRRDGARAHLRFG